MPRKDTVIFRYLVSIMALFLLTSLLLGSRYKGNVRLRILYGIGALSGLSGGYLGMPGPSVIFFYLSGAYNVAVERATKLLFLLAFDVVFWSRL